MKRYSILTFPLNSFFLMLSINAFVIYFLKDEEKIAREDKKHFVNKTFEKDKLSSPAPFLKNYMQKAQVMNEKYGFVYFQFINEGYLKMAKSWICNVKDLGNILEKTLFLTTDMTAYLGLKSFNSTLNVYLEVVKTRKSFKFKEKSYVTFMKFRTNIILNFLQHNISLWIIESDAIWYADPCKYIDIYSEWYDMVCMPAAGFNGRTAAGGFILLKPTTLTLQLWKSLTKLLPTNYNEMTILNKLIRKVKPHIIWLSNKYFPSGQWYSNLSYQKASRPVVIQNNYIVGNEKKISRAKHYNQWYLNDTLDSCTNAKH